MNLIATQGRLIVEFISTKKKTTSGGILLSQETDDLRKGKVISMGLPAKDETPNFKEGDIVCWQNYSGVEIRRDNKDYTILNQKDIIAVEVSE